MSYYDGQGTFIDGTISDRTYSQVFDSRWRMVYPAAFFDPIAMQTVADPKMLIQWCRFFFEWHPIVNAAIQKMASSPITDFIYDTTDPKLRKNYEMVFETLNIRNAMLQMGLDYFVCGNSFLSTIMPFKRFFECPECKFQSSVEAASFKPALRSISMVCNKCGATVKPVIRDVQTHDINSLRLIHWNPMEMAIDHDPILGKSDYYVGISADIKQGILRGDKKYIANYPQYFVDAVHQNKMLKLYPEKLLHLKRTGHSAALYKGWGQPVVSPVLKHLFHLLVLMRAQDALAIDQILPWTIISPAQSGSTDPINDVNLSEWRSSMQKEYEQWKKDPTRKSFFPFPVQPQMIGGQAKALMVTPEISELMQQIIAGMGIPQEFVYGGLQWSGASVSLRMLENQMLNYRTMMQRVIDWIVQQVALYLGYPPISIRLQPFKMADDIAQKKLIYDMASAGVIARSTMLNQLMPDLSYEKEQEKILTEQLQIAKRQREVSAKMPPPPMSMGDPSQSQANPDQKPPRAQGENKQI